MSLHKHLVESHFSNAVESYDNAAFLQREIANRLLERLEDIQFKPKRILDLGAGTGYCTTMLSKRFPKASIIALDLSQDMLKKAQKNSDQKNHAFICADAEQLPFASEQFDLVISNCMLQWCHAYTHVVFEVQRILARDGYFLFSTLGRDTLYELRESFAASGSPYTHVHRFLDMHDLGDALLNAGFLDPVVDMEHLTVLYDTPLSVCRDLKALGAQNTHASRQATLSGKTLWKNMVAYYENTFKTKEGDVPATYEIIYGHAISQAQTEGMPPHDGRMMIPLRTVWDK